MRTKALLLGALPKPQVGNWVPIDEGKGWCCLTQGMNSSNNGVRLDVQLSNGDIIPFPLSTTEPFFGQRARLVIERALVGVETFSVHIIEVKL